MRRGGHASPTAALRYQHEAEGRDREIADALGSLFDAPRDRGAHVRRLEPRDGRRKICRSQEQKRRLTSTNNESG